VASRRAPHCCSTTAKTHASTYILFNKVEVPREARKASARASRPLGRAHGLGALRCRSRGSGGALGLERLATALAVGGIGGGNLGLVRAHVPGERGA
jgi:hypothetical protein